MNNEQQNDWLATILYNPDKDFANFKAAGLDASNTTLGSRDSYLDIPAIQETFKDSEGNFDKKAFDQFYDSANRTYNTFVQDDLEDKFLHKLVTSPLDIFSDNESVTRTPLFVVQKISNPTLKSQGINGLFGEGVGTLSMRQAAQTQRVFDTKSGKELDWTPDDDDKSGFFDFMFIDPLVEARWEEDGYHEDADGRKIKHYKGDYKLNANGMPYYETLGDRDAAGKNFLHWTDTLTSTGSKWEKYNFLASDGVEKSALGTTLKLAATVAPMLVPYVGQAYGIATGAMYFGQALSIFGKTLIDAVSDSDAEDRPGVWKLLNKTDAFVRKFDSSTSDEGSQGMFNYEQFATLISDVVGQLYQQRSIAKIPQWIGWDGGAARKAKAFVDSHEADYIKKYGKTLKQAISDGDVATDYKNLVNNDLLNILTDSQLAVSKFAKNSSQFYMAMTQTKDMYDTFKENGFSDATTAIGMGAALYGFNKLFNTSLGEIALSGLGLDELKQANKRLVKGFINELKPQLDLVEKGAGTVSNAGKLKWIKSLGTKFKDFYEKHIVSDPEGWIANSLKESVEEVSEEALQDAVFEASNKLDWAFNQLGWTPKKGNYNFLASSPLERYYMSALGGAVGGAIFPAITKMENLRDGIQEIQKKIPESLAMDIATTIRNNGVKKSIEYIKKAMDKGELGSTTLSMNLVTNKTDDGNVYYDVAKTREESQNNVIGNYLINYLNSLDSIINAEGYNMKDFEVIDNALMKDSRLTKLAQTGVGEDILWDFREQLKGYIDSTIELRSAGENADVGAVKRKQGEFKQKLDDIIAGKKNGEYVEKMAFRLSRSLSNPFVAPDIYSYAKYAKGLNYSTATEEQKRDIEKAYEGYTKLGETDKFNLGFEMWRNMKAEVSPAILRYRDSKVSAMKKQFYNVVEQLNASQGINQLSEDEIVAFKDEVRAGRTDDEIIAENNLNPREFALSPTEKGEIVDAYLTREIWKTGDDSSKIGPAYKQQLSKIVNSMSHNMAIGVDPILNQRRTGELQVLFESIKNLVAQSGFIDNEIKTMIDSVKNGYNKFNPENFIRYLSERTSMEALKGFTIEDEYEGIQQESTYIGTSDEVSPDDMQDINFDELKSENPNYTGLYYIFENPNGNYALTQDQLQEAFRDMFYTEFKGEASDVLIGGILSDGNLSMNSLNAKESLKKVSDYKKFNDFLLDYLKHDEERIALIAEVDRLSQSSMVNNPMWEMLSTLSQNISGEDVFKLIRDEEGNYSGLNNLSDYVISNSLTRDQLQVASTTITVLNESILPYLVQGTDFIDMSNQYKRNIGMVEDIPLTSEEVVLIRKELDNLQQKISWLTSISDMNSLSKTADSNKTMSRINSMYALIFSGNVDQSSPLSKFKTITYTDDNKNKHNLITEDFLTGDEIALANDIINSGKSDIPAISASNELILKVHKQIFDKFTNLSSDQKEEIISQLASGQIIDFNNAQSTKLKSNSTYSDLNELDLAQYLITMMAVEPEYLQGTLKQAILNNKLHAPFFNQMMSVQEMFALYKNPDVFNTFLEKVNEFKPFQDKSWGDSNTITKSLITLLGGAGTGKSTGVALTAYNMIKVDNPEAKVMIAGSAEDVAERLATTLGEEKSYDRLQLFKALLTDSGWNKMRDAIAELRNPETELSKLEEAKYLKNGAYSIFNPDFLTEEDVNVAAIPDVLFIDEYTHFTGIEIQALSSLNKFLPNDKKMIIFAIGDNKQEGIINKKSHIDIDLSGMYLNTPTLMSSIRANNVHKKDNLSKVSGLLNVLLDMQEASARTNTPLRIDSLMRELKSKTVLKYYESDEEGIVSIHGDKLANISELTEGYLKKIAKGLKEGERIALITDNVLSDFRTSVFKKLEDAYPGQAVVRDSHDVQGSEFKYTIIDVNWANLNTPTAFPSNLRYFYTLMSRSSDGNIIVKKDRNIVNKADKANTTSTSELKQEDISNYKNTMLEILKGKAQEVFETEEETTGDATIAPTITEVPTNPDSSDKIEPIVDRADEQDAANRAEAKEIDEREATRVENDEINSIKGDKRGNPGLKASTFQMNSFYNHLALNIKEDGVISTLPVTNNISEDLQGFSEFINGKTLDDIRSITLYGVHDVDLLKSLAYLRSLFMRKKSEINQMLSSKLAPASDYYRFLRPFIERYFDGDSKSKLLAFKSAIAKGNFLFKITKFKSGYDNAYNVENFEPLQQDTLFGRIVYQIPTDKGNLDVTLGSTSDFSKIIENSEYQNIVNILKDKKTLSSKIDSKGQVYYRLSDFDAIKTNISYGQNIYGSGYKWKPEVRNKFNRGNTLDKTKYNHPELQFSQVYYDADQDRGLGKKSITKGYPVVFISDDLWKQSPGELLGKHAEKISTILSYKNTEEGRPPRDVVFGVSKAALNMRGLTMREFFSEWSNMEDGRKGGRIYGVGELGRLARPVEAARFLYSLAALQAATIEEVENYNERIKTFNNSLVLPEEADWIKSPIAVGTDGKVDEIELNKIKDTIKDIFDDLESQFPQLKVGKLFNSTTKIVGRYKNVKKADESNTQSNPYTIKSISEYRTQPVSPEAVIELFEDIGLVTKHKTVDSGIVKILNGLSGKYRNMTKLLEKLTDPNNDIYSSPEIPDIYRTGSENFNQVSKTSAVNTFVELQTMLSEYAINASEALLPNIRKGLIAGFTLSNSVIRRLFYNHWSIRDSGKREVFQNAIDYAGLYKFGIWTNGLDSSNVKEPQNGYYISPLHDIDLYFDGPIQAPNYYVDYSAIDTSVEFEVNKTPEIVAEETPEIVVKNPVSQELEDNAILENANKNLQESIRNSIENNVSLQKDEVLEMVNAAINSNIVPIGNTLEEKMASYKTQLTSKIRENLRVLPRKLFINSNGIVSVSPTYSFSGDSEIVTDADSEVALSNFITKNELLNGTDISSVILNPEDIKYNESDETFSIKVNGYIYTYTYDGELGIEERSVIQDEIVSNTEQELEKYRNIVTKGIQDAIKEGTKPADITKLSKKELIAYNKAAKVANALNSFSPKQLDEIINRGFASKEASFLDIIEQVTGFEITPELKTISNMFSSLRTEYISDKDGKSNC